jgi:type VI secretion system protein ImpL
VISGSVLPLLGRIAQALNDTPGRVLITGHTDNQPIRTLRYPSNWHLSQDRADAVKTEITKTVKADRMRSEGRADSEVVADNSNAQGRAKNRRVEITLFVRALAAEPHHAAYVVASDRSPFRPGLRMKKFLLILFHPIALSIYGLLALAALIWWVGPLIAFGERHPLDGIWERVIAIALILLLFAGVAGGRGDAAQGVPMPRWSASLRPARTRRIAKARCSASASPRPEGARGECQRVRASARFFKRSQYLYELPWYMFIGAPGSGKTTALMNAGLTFPLAGKMGQASIKGVGGTRNCDWWFTDEAVLIDTAGRYTLQQSDEQVDASAWEKFLGLLKKSRPRRPINGVLLTVNVQDLLQQTPADRKEHAAKLRLRLQELHTHLGVRPPVYVMVTKCDLIAGFNETFGELGKEERDQVWGFSFPYDPRGNDTPMQEFGSEFAALETRLRNRLIDQIEGERDS